MTDLCEGPEVPWGVSEEIASWRRILHQTVGDKRPNLHRAAVELFRLAETVAPMTRQVIVDDLADIVFLAGIEDDEAQEIMAQASKAPKDTPCLNGAGLRKALEPGRNGPAEVPPLRFVNIDAWATREPPPREWAVRDRFPLRNVGLLSGDGGVGKTIVLMQLALAHVLAKDWLGMLLEPGPAVYLNAEDDDAEMHRRFAGIVAHYGVAMSDLKRDLHVLALAGQDAVLGYPDRNGTIHPTPLFERLAEAARDIRPKLIALDTSADIFAGNENDRAQVRQFIGLMRRMAIDANAAVIIAAHPSLTGINSGSGLSGNTAWHNSVRARAYLKSLKAHDGTEPDKTLRQLEFMKSNYGPVAEIVTLRWNAGVFIPEPKAGSLEKRALDAKADEVFLLLLDRFTDQGRTVGDKRGPSYAPASFAKEPEAKAAGPRREALAEAMRRLFAADKIHVENYGRPSRPATKIVAGPAPKLPKAQQ
jgi:RecA-family ATPase